MAAQLKVVSNKSRKLESSEIADLILQNKWTTVQEMNIDDFVYEVQPNQYAPLMKAIIQSRPETYDPTFVGRQVRKSKNGINASESATVVYFPENTVINGEEIESNTYRLIDRTHGMVIDKYLGNVMKFANVINFKHDLESDELKLYRLANLLNKVEKEVQPLLDEAIKLELYRLMDKRISEGKEGKPSDEERKSFLKDYSQINDRTWTNWVANHKSGGRRDPRIKYSPDELQAFHNQLKNMQQYNDYVITQPTTIRSWNGEALGRAVMELCDNETRKLLMPLYANNDAQFKQLDDGTIQKKIKTRFGELKKFLKLEEMEFIMMKY